jgi:hypothetical protein
MARPKPPGTINGFVATPAKIGRKRFTFDGTILGLTREALRQGATAGQRVQADFGGGFRTYTIQSTPHDQRVGGFWAVEVPSRG